MCFLDREKYVGSDPGPAVFPELEPNHPTTGEESGGGIAPSGGVGGVEIEQEAAQRVVVSQRRVTGGDRRSPFYNSETAVVRWGGSLQVPTGQKFREYNTLGADLNGLSFKNVNFKNWVF